MMNRTTFLQESLSDLAMQVACFQHTLNVLRSIVKEIEWDNSAPIFLHMVNGVWQVDDDRMSSWAEVFRHILERIQEQQLKSANHRIKVLEAENEALRAQIARQTSTLEPVRESVD